MLATIVGSALAAYGLVLGGLYVSQRHLLYFPFGGRPELGELAAIGVREVTVDTADRMSLLSWYLPPRDGRPVIAYFHGNGGHIGWRAERLLGFARHGYGVLMLEYRGFGGNPGTPTEAGLRTDAAAAFDFLEREGFASNQLVLYGESLGSGVAVALAVERDIAALILEAPFTSVAEVAQHHYSFVPAFALVRDRFDSRSVIGRVKAPILVLHGERDRIVPIRFGRALYEAAPQPKELWLARDAGHQDLARHGALEAAHRFIERRIDGKSLRTEKM